MLADLRRATIRSIIRGAFILYRDGRHIGGKSERVSASYSGREGTQSHFDALFFGLIKPFGTWLSKFRIFSRLGRWVRSLGPYSTLALFVIPFVVLEPLKPIGLYLIASGRVIDGTFVIGVGEVLKITIVERLFQVGRDKLMVVPAFARCYEFLMSWRAYFETLAVWQAMLRWARAIKERGHRMLAFGENWLASLKRKGG